MKSGELMQKARLESEKNDERYSEMRWTQRIRNCRDDGVRPSNRYEHAC